jgi:hypothetical protein
LGGLGPGVKKERVAESRGKEKRKRDFSPAQADRITGSDADRKGVRLLRSK